MLTIIQILLLTCKNHESLNLPRQIYAFLVSCKPAWRGPLELAAGMCCLGDRTVCRD